MENKQSNKMRIGTSIVAGSIIGLTGLQANEASLFTYDDLGSGATVRAELVKSERTADHSLELKCGKESKSEEAKCGENKAESSKEEGAKAESKSTEAKCGENKAPEKAESKESSESKASEAKCGEGKCGEGKCGGQE